VSNEEAITTQVFTLAYHLHWSRQSILDMPVAERWRYLKLLEEQLERERAAMKQAER
jgi:hypothetical protein